MDGRIKLVLDKKPNMLNREIGLINFQQRILSQTQRSDIPLLEKLRYLIIVSQNCDELFAVRIAKLIRLYKQDKTTTLPDGQTVEEILPTIKKKVSQLYTDIYQIYNKQTLPELEQEKILILNQGQWNPLIQNFAHFYFINYIKPILNPIPITKKEQLTQINNKNLCFLIELNSNDKVMNSHIRHSVSKHEGDKAQSSNDQSKSLFSIIQVPKILPGFIKVTNDISENKIIFLPIQEIINLYIQDLISDHKVKNCYPFRITRYAELNIKNKQQNLRLAIEQELAKANLAPYARLELDISGNLPNPQLIKSLLNYFDLNNDDLYLARGPLSLSGLSEIISTNKNPQLIYPVFIPTIPTELKKTQNIFHALKKNDILIHTPYQSFDPIIELTKQAAIDPQVTTIKLTVYRIVQGSELVQNLINAAKAGKKVVASIELFARFEEAANIELAKQLEEAGVNVVYGVMGYKVHAKMLLIIRKENNQLVNYAHLGTGNYHQTAAKTYTDFGLLTTNPLIVNDVESLFAQITGMGHANRLTTITQSPYALHDLIHKHIEQEIVNAKQGLKAQIIAKVNSLIEPSIIKALYKASQAGVKIKLIVRGACALRPGIKNLSKNIKVISIIGRFLEHHRIFYFYSNGKKDIYIASADWMRRNFFHRIETCIPILSPKIKQRIWHEGLQIYLKDNVDAWVMDKNGTYKRKTKNNISAQQYLMQKLGTTSMNPDRI